MNKILYLIIIITLFACNNTKTNTEQDDLQISGTILNVPKNTYISLIHRSPDNSIILDSVLIIDSSFELKANISDNINFYVLKLTNNDYFIHLLADSNDKIILEADFLNLQSYKIENSKESVLLQELENQLFNTNKAINELTNANADKNQIEELIEKQRKFSLDFISRYYTSLAVIIAFSERFITGEPVLPIEEYFEFFKSTNIELQKKYSKSEHYLQFAEFIKNYELLLNRNSNINTMSVTPSELVNFTTKTIDGKNFELNSLKGKWILINFWASWCVTCTENNDIIRKIISKKPEINIVQISIDKKEDILKDSLKNYNFNHIIINDLKAWNSELINLYNIQILPTNILINPQGEIVLYSSNPQELFEYLF